MDTIMISADIISLNKTYFWENDTLTSKIMGIIQNGSIFWYDHNNSGGGVILMLNKKLMPEQISLNCDCKVLAVKISKPTKLHIVSVYRPPSTPMCKFTDELLKIVSKLKEIPTCIVGDFNGNISITCKRHCCSMLTWNGFKQMVKKPTDSETLIDHVCVSQKMSVTTDVTDCYYSDHDYVYNHLNPTSFK